MTFIDQDISLEKCPALVLNADYRPLSYYPLSIWCWQDAVKSVFLNRVSIVSNYKRKIRSPSFEMNPFKIWTFFLLTVATYLLVNLCKFYLASRLKSKLTDTFLFKIKQALNILIFVCGAFFVFKGI